MTERPAKYRAETNQVPAWSSIRVFGVWQQLLAFVAHRFGEQQGGRYTHRHRHGPRDMHTHMHM